MVADDYFELRSRLGTALFSLGRVADLAGLKPSRTPVVKSLVEGLRDPFLFVVAGEVNAGKSTLLNALFGEEFCVAGVLPETRRIQVFRYSREPERQLVEEDLEEVGLPHAFLRDFHVVDTPGVNSVASGHEKITEEFLPRADAVLFCFPATNPWSAAAWEFLARIHADWLKKIVLVLQQSDLRSTAEVTAIREHMELLSRQRLGVTLPVFAVSGRLALLGRTSGLDKTRLLADSGFPALEQQLTRLVAGAAPRMSKLITACSAGQAILAEIQNQLSGTTASLLGLKSLQEEAARRLAETRHRLKLELQEARRELEEIWNQQQPAALGESLKTRSGPGPARGNNANGGMDPWQNLWPRIAAKWDSVVVGFSESVKSVQADLEARPGRAIAAALAGRREETMPLPPSGDPGELLEESRAKIDTLTPAIFGLWNQRLRRRTHLIRGILAISLAGCIALGYWLYRNGGAGTSWGTVAVVMAGWGLIVWLMLRRETLETKELLFPALTEAGHQLVQSTLSCLEAAQSRTLDAMEIQWQPFRQLVQLREQTLGPLAGEAESLALAFRDLSRSLHPGRSSGITSPVPSEGG